MTDTTPWTVTDADREAADGWLENGDMITFERFEQSLAQAFAKHRHEATAELVEALRKWEADALSVVDFYERNGPQWTSPQTGHEYYDASYVIDSAQDRLTEIRALLAKVSGQSA